MATIDLHREADQFPYTAERVASYKPIIRDMAIAMCTEGHAHFPETAEKAWERMALHAQLRWLRRAGRAFSVVERNRP